MTFSTTLNFSFGKRLPLILQTESCECGLACMAMIATYHGHHTNLPDVRKNFPISLKGTTLAQIAEIASGLGFTSRALRIELKHLRNITLPALLHWDLNHFVVLHRIHGDFFLIHDPAAGLLKIKTEKISEHFTGIALELAPGLTFERKAAAAQLKISELIGKVSGLKRGLLQIFLLAVILEVFSLGFPLLTQWITDEAIVGEDKNLLTILSIGLIAIGLSSALITGLRNWIGIYISTNFNMQWMSNVMGHLLRLPVSYFERRHLGDIVSRFGAVREIEQSLTNASIDAAMDGILSLSTFAMMVMYSPLLAMVTLSSVVAYALLRYLRYGGLRRAAAGAVVKKAREQTYFLESIRGARSIKLFNGEIIRQQSWLNLWVDATNSTITTQKLTLIFNAGWSFLSTMERAAIFWIGATLVIDHKISLGMLFAFLTYKEQFAGRVNMLIDRFVDFKMLAIQAERLSDIMLTKTEEDYSYRKHDIPQDLTLSIENLSFRYSSEERFILNEADVIIRQGECVALVGPSGCGKSTLLKIMLGLLKSQKGFVKIGGLTIQQIGLKAYRNIISTVMQDDNLFTGSIYENICMFDQKPDEDWLYTCAKTANIHDEIIDMIMGYHTLVGDMGTVLSGGQKQRVMLARALYRRPKILFLDEATSHLDIENERLISSAIASLKITRIMIAHRPQTIAIAERVIHIQQGKILEEDDMSLNTKISPTNISPTFEVVSSQ